MKRWQERGVVEDSEEDEDINLDTESPSPGRPRKRQKHNQDVHVARASVQTSPRGPLHHHAQEAEDEVDWTQPKVAKTYGKKVRVASHVSKQSSPRLDSEKSSPLHSASEAKDITETLVEAQHALHPATQNSTTDPKSAPLGAVDTVIPEETRTEDSTTVGAIPRIQRYVLPYTNSETLRDTRDFVSVRSDSNDITSTQLEHDSTSSPLSEREESPPPGWDSITSDRISPNEIIHTTFWDNMEAENATLNGEVTLDDLPATTTRRALRNRKPIQLQPYQLERTLYLQKCKARGMKAVVEEERERAALNAQAENLTASSQSQDAASVLSATSPKRGDTREKSKHDMSLTYFDAVTDSSDEELRTSHRLPKRRRIMTGLDSTTILDSHRKLVDPHRRSQTDEFIIPPSPPRTASDASTLDDAHLNARETVSGFKMPAGFTPAPLPTPQISSETKRHDVEDSSMSDSPPRKSRASMVKRRVSMSNMTLAASSDNETETKADSDAEVSRIMREKRRLKGVLPASWLRINFNAQRTKETLTSRQRRPGTSSIPRLKQQKGVAKHITTNKPPEDDRSSALPTLSGEDSDSGGSVQMLKSLKKQSPLYLEQERASAVPSMTIQDDLMENDYVDAMLAGSSRVFKSRISRAHQPRITQAFRKTSTLRNDFSEERPPRKSLTRAVNEGQLHRGKYTARSRHRHRQQPHVRLSILDAVGSPCKDNQLPDFVRLALRRTRHHPEKGRHSPRGKVVRLATAKDTDEASSVLHAWRAGTLTPRAVTKPPDTITLGPPDEAVESRRVALANLSPNRQQHNSSAPGAKHNRYPRMHPRSPRKLRLRQTQLTPAGLSESLRPVRESAATPARPNNLERQPLFSNRLRMAQLESLQTDFEHGHRDALFERRIQCLTEHVAIPTRHVRASGLQLERFLHANMDDVSLENVPDDVDIGDRDAGAASEPAFNLPRRQRKRQARKIDIKHSKYQPPQESLPVDLSDGEHHPSGPAGPVLQGLDGLRTRHPIDFDIRPLEIGMNFASGSFIGSGDFAEALRLSRRQLDKESGLMRVHIHDEILEWGIWNEEVVVGFTKIPLAISEALQTFGTPEGQVNGDRAKTPFMGDRKIDYLLRSVVRYCSKSLAFADPVDRVSCLESLQRLSESLSEMLIERGASVEPLRTTFVRIAQYQLVLTEQATQICDHPTVPFRIKRQAEQRQQHVSETLCRLVFPGRFKELRAAIQLSSNTYECGLAAQEDDVLLSSLVLLNHTLWSTRASPSPFWQALGGVASKRLSDVYDVAELEDAWHNIFTVLPVLEVDSTGIARVGSRFSKTQDGSLLVKGLISRVLELYEASSHVRGCSINDYVRTVLSRCYCLATEWGWRRCESVLNCIYDFFARRNFALLHKEEARGSPKFLEDLASHSALEILPDDRSFHMFLKLLLTGLKRMRKYAVYGDKKIQAIAYRLLPNHGRTFRRDTEVEHGDLDALRNHYDLLCTLYYATPPRHRISLDGVRNLIDHAVSHREACRISVRAWANITSFQASTSEPVELMQTLGDWFASMFKTALTQYRLAKPEAESDYRRAQEEAERAGMTMPASILESTIANNQMVIAKTIVDALAGLKRALKSCSSSTVAKTLIEASAFWVLFELFDSTQNRLSNAVMEALQVVNAVLDVEQRHYLESGLQKPGSDDSQEYGDFSALEELVEKRNETCFNCEDLSTLVLDPVGHLLSNVFGADRVADDGLLRTLVDVWVRLAGSTVMAGGKTWISYVDEYSTNSWYQMRDTAQKRKFTTYFMSCVLEESLANEEVRLHIMTYWALSLVEREATLKFQGVLTSSLLNHCPQEPLLQNLPFIRDTTNGRYQISLDELRQRRLALISCILCNMRESLEDLVREYSARKNEVKSLYASLLRQLMQAMKMHYQELHTSRNNQVADVNAQGAYVEFVQHVVSLLQQYVANICPVDRFFTDSIAFPLPATDPTYVVGRLRSYAPKLKESNARMQLAIFVQSVSERAAIDGQQQYLVDQLCAAMKRIPEKGDETTPTLRHVLFTAIIPAYIEHAFSVSSAWIPAVPMLQAAKVVLPDMLYNMVVESEKSVHAVEDTIAAMLHSIGCQCDYVLAQQSLLGFPNVLKILAAMIGVGCSCVTVAFHLKRAAVSHGELFSRLQTLHEQSAVIQSKLKGSDVLDFRNSLTARGSYSTRWPDTRAVADQQVQDSLNTNWYNVDGCYTVRRGNTSKQLVVELGDIVAERETLLYAIDEFDRSLNAIIDARTRRRQATHENTMLDMNLV